MDYFLSGERKSANIDVKALYGKGKSSNIAAEVTSGQQEYGFKVKTNTPQAEQLKKLEFSVATKVMY